MRKKKIILYIDTSDNRKVEIALKIDGKKTELLKETDNWTSQALLPLIDEILLKNRISFTQLTEVRVNTGPGSFTGLRVGVAVANTLGWLLGIPVNKHKDKFAEPHYK